MSEILMVASGKGGVGKTTAVAFLGSTLAQMGKSVCLIDTDVGCRNLDLIFAMDRQRLYNMVDVLEGVCTLKQALLPLDTSRKFYLLPGSRNYSYTFSQGTFVELLADLTREFDIIICDTSAGMTPTHQMLFPLITRCLLLTNGTPEAIRDAVTIQSNALRQTLPFSVLFNPMEKREGRMSDAGLLELGREVFPGSSVGIMPYLGRAPLQVSKKNRRQLLYLCREVI